MPDVAAHRDFYARGGYCEGYDEGGAVDSIGEPEDPLAFAGGGDVLKGVSAYLKRIAEPIKAWHGTPHDIDRFDASKIGTGEGNQTFGHGLYFAENPEVAKWYRESLVGRDSAYFRGDSPVGYRDIQTDLASHELGQGYGPPLIRDLVDSWADVKNPKSTVGLFSSDKESSDDMLLRLRRSYSFGNESPERLKSLYDYLDSTFTARRPGNLYEVGIHRSPDDFLHLDKPIDQQMSMWQRLHPEVRDAIDERFESRDLNGIGAAPEAYKGNDLMRALQHYDVHESIPAELPGSSWMGDTNEAKHTAAYLQSLDVPGVRYLDANSRRRGDGTHNYVVFPGAEDLIDIQSRYAHGGSVDDDMLAYDSQYYAEGGNVDAGEDDHGKGRFTYSPEALRKFREQTAFENALAYALRDMPDPKSVPYMRGVGSVSVASPFDRTESASHDYAHGGSVDDDFLAYDSMYYGEGGYLRPAMKWAGRLFKGYRGSDHSALTAETIDRLMAEKIFASRPDAYSAFEAANKSQMEGSIPFSQIDMGYVDHRGNYLDRAKAMDYAKEHDLIDTDQYRPEVINRMTHLPSEILRDYGTEDFAEGGQVAGDFDTEYMSQYYKRGGYFSR